jgi:hypothetical protein
MNDWEALMKIVSDKFQVLFFFNSSINHFQNLWQDNEAKFNDEMNLQAFDWNIRESWRNKFGVNIIIELITILENGNKNDGTIIEYFRTEIKPCMFDVFKKSD